MELWKRDIDIHEFTGTVTEGLLQPSPQDGVIGRIRFIRWRTRNRIIYLKPMSYQIRLRSCSEKIAQYGLKSFGLGKKKKVEDHSWRRLYSQWPWRWNRSLQSMYGLSQCGDRSQPRANSVPVIFPARMPDRTDAGWRVIFAGAWRWLHLIKGLHWSSSQKHPELETVLNKLAGKITESQIVNYQVGGEGKSAEQETMRGVSTRGTRFVEVGAETLETYWTPLNN